jgi:hypothetical protein
MLKDEVKYDEVMVEIRGFALVLLPRSNRDVIGHLCALAEPTRYQTIVSRGCVCCNGS